MATRKKIPLIPTDASLDVTGDVSIAGSGSAVITFPSSTSTLLYSGGDAGTPSALVGTNISGTAASLTAGAVTNATLTTALTVNTGTVTLTGNAANSSVLTIGAGAVSISGTNTGDNTVCTSGAATTATKLFTARKIGGVDFDGSADIVPNIVTDTTPELGGELDCGAHSIGFTQQTATGDGTTTINWTLGNKMKFTFGAQAETFTFTAPSNPCNLVLMMVQDGTGSRTATFPATVKWAGGTAPTLTTTASGIDIISFYYDGTSYHGVASLAFATPV